MPPHSSVEIIWRLTITGTVAGRRIRRRAQATTPSSPRKKRGPRSGTPRTAWHKGRPCLSDLREAALSYLEAAPRWCTPMTMCAGYCWASVASRVSDRSIKTLRPGFAAHCLSPMPSFNLSATDRDTIARDTASCRGSRLVQHTAHRHPEDPRRTDALSVPGEAERLDRSSSAASQAAGCVSDRHRRPYG